MMNLPILHKLMDTPGILYLGKRATTLQLLVKMLLLMLTLPAIVVMDKVDCVVECCRQLDDTGCLKKTTPQSALFDKVANIISVKMLHI